MVAQNAPEVGYDRRAQIYDVEYATTVDHDFLRSLVTDQVESVLEIPCGAGRNLPWLIDSGRRTVCADLEPGMVDKVRQRAQRAGATGRISAVTANMCTFDLRRTFDLVLVPQEAFQLIESAEDAYRALVQLRRHLSPHGVLLLDLHTFTIDSTPGVPALPDYYDPEFPDGVVVEEWKRPLKDGGWLTRARTQLPAEEHMQIDYHYRLDQGGVRDEWRSTIRLRRYTRQSVLDLATRAGLRVERTARDYRGTEWEPGAARMITLLRLDDRRTAT